MLLIVVCKQATVNLSAHINKTRHRLYVQLYSFTGGQDKSGLFEPHCALGTELLAAGSMKSLIQDTVRKQSNLSFQPSLIILQIVGLYFFGNKYNSIIILRIVVYLG